MKALLSLLIVACTGLLLSTGIHAQDANAPKGRIVFSKLVGDSAKLWVMNADGTDAKEIPTSTKLNLYPSCSPDGKNVAYTGFETFQANPDIYTINLDGTGEKRLSSGTDFSIIPAWSKDGKQILYTTRQGNGMALRIANLDGSVAMDFPSASGITILGFWSPDGKRIGFTRGEQNMPSGNLHLMNADGSNSEMVTTGAGLQFAGHGAWSPDGKTIAVTKMDPIAMTGSLWLLDVSSKSEMKVWDTLTGGPPDNFKEAYFPTAAWSPDGKWMAALITENGKGRIYLVSPDGKTRKALTAESETCLGPSWTK